MSAESPQIDPKAVRRSFDRASRTTDASAALQKEVRNRMLQRLDLVKLDPAVIVDLGSGTAHAAKALRKKYPNAQVIALDRAAAMLREASRQQSLFRKFHRVCADAAKLPLPDCSVDLLFSNLLLQWCEPPDLVFAEARRVLKPRGLFIFSTLGPDTLKELRTAWAAVDNHVHVHRFLDMHDIGDALVRARLAEPVMDVEYFTLTFPDVRKLARELKAIGAQNVSHYRQTGLTSRRKFAAMTQAYEALRSEGKIPATCEVVYGNAWGPVVQPGKAGEVRIPLERLRRSRPGAP